MVLGIPCMEWISAVVYVYIDFGYQSPLDGDILIG